MYNKLINYIVIAFTILSSISFFKFTFIPSGVIKASEIITIGLLIFFNVLYAVYGPKDRSRGRFSLIIYFLLLSSIPCIFAANAWHDQSLQATIWSQRLLLMYLFYITLKNFDIDYKILENIIYTLGICVALAYLVQYLIYPSVLINVGILVGRGTIRIIDIPGQVYHDIALLYSFSRLLKRFEIKHLIVFLFLLAVFALYGSRGIIVTTAGSMILLILISKSSSSKYVIGLLIFGIAALVLIQFKDIFIQVFATSTRDVASGANYIRIRAAKYFLTDFYPNPLAYFIGNGDYYNVSPYGLHMQSLVRNYGFYLSDLGIVMPYVKYGIFFIIGIIMILVKALKMEFAADQLYIKAFIINLIIYFPLGGGYGNPGFIIALVMLLYINEKANITNLTEANQQTLLEESVKKI